ncbi:hypothetical protein N7523_006743 [Penicillium sp. IBT 18751x]|nr:hypothetical protein N7523_006743 [Penicillium sp. IBT 18751x]
MGSSGKVAFVTGANGITGHAIIEHLIRTPESDWSKIIITSRRPPATLWVDPRVEFLALDFMESPEIITNKIKVFCKDVTHAYFTSYIHNNDFNKLAEQNCPLFRNFLEAVDTACPVLERVCLQTGGKHYGVQFRELCTPCYEEMPRYEGPGSGSIFYYEQEDDLFRIQKRRNSWNYNIIRPMGIIGFTPQFNGMNEAILLAQYFLICRELGESPVWPGNLRNFHRAEHQCYAPSIADLTVWATTHDNCQDKAFNHSNGDVIVFKFLWTHLAKYFNVRLPPSPTASARDEPAVNLAEWAKGKKEVWEQIVAKYGGKAESFQAESFAFLTWCLNPTGDIETPVLSTVTKARNLGWNRTDDPYEAFSKTFRAYENAGILPSSSQFH